MEREVEEKEVVMIDDEEEESSSSLGNSSKRRRKKMGLKWDDIISRGSLRVLLIEGDDSTRQIIAALLRKCNYKVAAVADGLKAWDILKEKAGSIDVILMEVELPSLPGVDLLSLIMGHEICEHIPVIMISYNDSVNMVYKCMLKGAADFLVKPVRKNELRNLWQHVWRRRKLTDGQNTTKVNKGDDANKRLKNVDNNKEHSEKKSFTESSCRSSDMEAQSNFKQNKLALSGNLLFPEILLQNPEAKIHYDTKDHGTVLPEEEHSCAEVENTTNRNVKLIEFSKTYEVEDRTCVDLIGGINNQSQLCYGLTDSSAIPRNGNYSCKSDSPPHLELSLKRCVHVRAINDKEEDKSDSHTLNHSNSSPFSLYTNNNNQASREGNYSQCDANEYNYEPYTNQTPSDNFATKCSPIRVIPQQFLFGGVGVKQTLYQGSSQILWSPKTTQSNNKLDHCASQTEHVYKELRDESSGICNGSGTSRNEFNGNNTSTNTSYTNHAEKKQIDLSRLNQREAALNKFRLKRKERCYEKRVRYQSRKKLAEQRPRVKGQFVKHIQPDGQ